MQILAVSETLRPTKLTNAIANALRVDQSAEVQPADMEFVNPAVNTIMMARKSLKAQGIKVTFTPMALDLDGGREITATKFIVKAHKIQKS